MMSSREQIANLLTDHSPRLGWDLTKNDCHPCTDTCGGEGTSFSHEEMLCSGLDPGRAPSRSWSIRADPSPARHASLTRRMPSRCWRSSHRAPVGVSTWRTCLTLTASRRLLRRDVRGGESRQRRARTTSPSPRRRFRMETRFSSVRRQSERRKIGNGCGRCANGARIWLDKTKPRDWLAASCLVFSARMREGTGAVG